MSNFEKCKHGAQSWMCWECSFAETMSMMEFTKPNKGDYPELTDQLIEAEAEARAEVTGYK